MLFVRFAPGRTQSIDGRSRAPAVPSLGTIKAGEQRAGEHYAYAHTIPTTLVTLDRASRKCGVLRPERLMAYPHRGSRLSGNAIAAPANARDGVRPRIAGRRAVPEIQSATGHQHCWGRAATGLLATDPLSALGIDGWTFYRNDRSAKARSVTLSGARS